MPESRTNSVGDMSLKEYNNQTILTLNNAEPINDNQAKERDNSLRLLFETTEADKWYECRNVCDNNPDCVSYDFDKENTLCKIYRKEPYKTTHHLSLDNCTKFCSHDNRCDFLSHSIDNQCSLFTREKLDGRASIKNLWFDFPIYGVNAEKGIKTKTFEECLDKSKSKYVVFYKDKNANEDTDGYCIERRFFKQNPGNTAIYFNKTPVDQYKSLNPVIGLKSRNRENIEKYKSFIVFVWFIILLIFCYYFAILFLDF